MAADAHPTKTVKKLEGLAKETLSFVKNGKNPYLSVPTRTLANVRFNQKSQVIELKGDKQKRYFFNVGQSKKFMQTFLVASACKELINLGKTTSIRDLYYMTKHTLGESRQNTFEEQEESDPVIEDLEVTVDALREELNLFASNRGALVGEITLRDAGDTIDGRRMGSGGWSIPSIVEDNIIEFKRCDAKFILLVEKDAVWRRLNEDKFWKKHKCILVTGQGQPPRGVRRLCRRMTKELKLPLYVLVDNDPWGLYIYSVIKQGSINLAYESMRMAVPNVRFLGMSAFDYKKFTMPRAAEIKLKKEDVTRAEQMKAYPWFKDPKWQREIQAIVDNGFKMEVDALLTKRISFITEEYIPKKLRDRDYLQ